MGTTAVMLFFVCAVVERNQRVLDAFEVRRAQDDRRAAVGLPPKTRHRRRTLDDLVTASPP